MNNNSQLIEMEKIFLALGDKTRIRILNLLRETAVNVNLFSEILGESQPKISRHLAYLKNAGVVETERAGKMIYYKLLMPSNSFQSFILQDILYWLENDFQMNAEHDKLQQFFGTTEISEQINHEVEQNRSAEANMSLVREELAIYLL